MKKYMPFILAILIVSCSKEINSDFKDSSVNTSEQSNSIVADTYLPLTPGTYWDYSVIKDNGSAKPSTFTVLNYKKNINGKPYTGVKTVSEENTDTVYYNQTNTDYYIGRYQQVSTSDGSEIEFLFLKDAPVGTKWSQSLSAGSTKLKVTGKILQRDITINVGGTTYKNVIHSYIEIKKPVLFTSIVISKQDFYVSKNIGIVKNISKVVFPTSSTVTTSITGYKIK